jgi:hypothetical protein
MVIAVCGHRCRLSNPLFEDALVKDLAPVEPVRSGTSVACSRGVGAVISVAWAKAGAGPRARRSSTSYFRGRSGIGIGFPAKSRRCFVTGPARGGMTGVARGRRWRNGCGRLRRLGWLVRHHAGSSIFSQRPCKLPVTVRDPPSLPRHKWQSEGKLVRPRVDAGIRPVPGSPGKGAGGNQIPRNALRSVVLRHGSSAVTR